MPATGLRRTSQQASDHAEGGFAAQQVPSVDLLGRESKPDTGFPRSSAPDGKCGAVGAKPDPCAG